MELVKTALAQQHDLLQGRISADLVEQGVIDHPPAQGHEPLIKAADPVPALTRHQHQIGFRQGGQSAMDPALARGADLEQAIAVGGPADGGEELILDRAVIALGRRDLLGLIAEMKAERGDDGVWMGGQSREGQSADAGTGHAGAVNDHADDRRTGKRRRTVQGDGGRATQSVIAQHAHVGGDGGEPGRIDRIGGAIISNQDLDIAGVHGALIGGAE